jgi:cell division protein FtsW
MTADRTLFYLVSFLIFLSVVFSLSLSSYTVLLYDYDSFHFFLRQLIAGTIGIVLMWYISQLDPDNMLHFLGFFFFFTFLFLMFIMHFLPDQFVTSAGGAKRWIRLPGFSIAPIEFFKIGFVYFLAWSFSRKVNINQQTSLKEEAVMFIPYMLVFLVVVFLTAVMQNDLGQVIVMGLTLVLMYVFAGATFKLFLIAINSALLLFTIFIAISDHRIKRIKEWWGYVQEFVLNFFPESIAAKLHITDAPEPYQISHSLNAIKNGGITGTGLGSGTFKLGFLSEVHTDFVLAGIAEEIGFIGVAMVTFVMLLIIYRIFKIANRSESKVFHLFAIGIALLITFSFLMNSFGVTSLTPIKGIAVPFVSYGGSSMLSSCIAIGMVLMISKRIRS